MTVGSIWIWLSLRIVGIIKWTRTLTEGQGKLFVRGDSKVFRFQNGKSESLFLQRKNPRRIAWTVLCRRQRRKGISEVRGVDKHIHFSLCPSL